jgi:iron complex transport system permease protein
MPRGVAGVTERSRFIATILVVFAVLVVCTMVSLVTGAVSIAPRDVFTAILHPHATDMNAAVLWSIRVPRVVAAIVVGCALALSGLCFQALLRNPLASEYTLGVSSGASLGAVLAALMHITIPLATPISAFIGAIATIAIVLYLSHARLSFETNATILAGVIFTSLANAALSLILSVVSPNELHTFFFWFMGSFANSEWSTLTPVAIIVGVLSVALYAFAWQMNALAVGDDFAAQVGVPIERTKTTLFVLASLLTALVVSIAGTIGFVGLVVPHLARLAIGVDNRKLIPVAALAGAALCVSADLLARTLLAPNELPVGVVTAFIGVPVFIVLMRRRT